MATFSRRPVVLSLLAALTASFLPGCATEQAPSRQAPSPAHARGRIRTTPIYTPIIVTQAAPTTSAFRKRAGVRSVSNTSNNEIKVGETIELVFTLPDSANLDTIENVTVGAYRISITSSGGFLKIGSTQPELTSTYLDGTAPEYLVSGQQSITISKSGVEPVAKLKLRVKQAFLDAGYSKFVVLMRRWDGTAQCDGAVSFVVTP